MRDEDILRKAVVTGKVQVNGEEFPIKYPEKPRIPKIDGYKSEFLINFKSFSKTEDTHIFTNVYGNNNAAPPSRPGGFFFNPNVHMPTMNEPIRPEVAFREGVRAAIKGGLSNEKMREILTLEVMEHIMDV